MYNDVIRLLNKTITQLSDIDKYYVRMDEDKRYIDNYVEAMVRCIFYGKNIRDMFPIDDPSLSNLEKKVVRLYTNIEKNKKFGTYDSSLLLDAIHIVQELRQDPKAKEVLDARKDFGI